MDASAISFGPFRLVAAQRLLLEGDKPVRLGSRAFDILAALVERAGQVVGCSSRPRGTGQCAML
jgi:DNA-binding winged helix-turn-helix (wHTH) protein